MKAYDVIKKKRDGGELSPDEIEFLIKGVTDGSVADYQASAFLMAVYLKGMTQQETVALTRTMAASGKALDTSGVRGVKTDKHSTGGVGDKTSIILAPLMATMGINVPMVSGRGLGHTGGTLDKLSSIPGFRLDLSPDEAVAQLRDLRVFIMGQTDDLAPADRKLYSLRDVTATVDSIPLIAASILSKKLAEGIDGLVLDVKVGSGGFMEDEESARRLAETLVETGNALGLRTLAVMTGMETPLGRTVGNTLELKECITALRGKSADDLREVVLTLAAWALFLTDAISEEFDLVPMTRFVKEKYMNEANEFIVKGDAFKKFLEIVDAQGGDVDTVLNPSSLPTASGVMQIKAESGGMMRRLDAEAVGRAAMLLGAGRETVEGDIDPAAGIIMNKKPGQSVEADDIIAMFHYNDDRGLKDAEEAFRSGIEIGDRDRALPPIIRDIIGLNP
jgi:pyrimidine-nucleoside phosphorylase